MTPESSDEYAEINRLASDQMHRGIALVEGGSPDALNEAIRCFDEAIDLRKRLPLAENAGFRYGLAAGWINRADALTRLGGASNLEEAVASYTTAIDLLKEPPADDDGSYARRLAIAWMNRGVALEQQKSEPALAEAILSYKESIRLLSGPEDAGLVLASAWINLANASLRSGGGTLAGEACGAAEHALALLAEIESETLVGAEAALKARYILCQAITVLLGENSHDGSIDLDLVTKLTDGVEGALRLVRGLEKAGATPFRPLAAEFFHLGALAYEKYQPHFLVEYLFDHLEPESPLTAPWSAIAEQSLARARRGLMHFDFASLATAQGVRRIELLAEIRAAEERIQTLRNSGGASADVCVPAPLG
jgi:tetratricopeptide (TPR) repeat protein